MPSVPSPTPLSILAVEDSPAQLFFIRRVLEKHGLLYTMQVITDGTQALHFFDHLAQHMCVPCPDLLLLDLHLPGSMALHSCDISRPFHGVQVSSSSSSPPPSS